MEDILKIFVGPLVVLIVNYFAFFNQNQKRINEMNIVIEHQKDEIKNLKEQVNKVDTKIESKIDSIRNEIKNDIRQLNDDIKRYIDLLVKNN